MTTEKPVQSEIGGYISTMLRKHFGKGPTSVFVTVKPPYVTIHFRGFLAPMEKVLLKQHEEKRILETRDLLLNELRSDIILQLWKIAELDIKEIYADWNLEKGSGMFLCIMNEEKAIESFPWPEDVDKESLYQEINLASEKVEKMPASTGIYWLSERTIVVVRSKILVPIEKELINNGFTETLKVVKRPLEQRVLKEVKISSVLNRNIIEAFVDWNFETDHGFVVFVLNPVNKNI